MANGARSSRFTAHFLPREAVDSLPLGLRFSRGCGGAKIFLAAFAVLTFLSSVASAQISTRTDSSISEIKNLFDNGSYISAELQARRVLEDRTVSDSARVQLEKYLGFALVAQGRNEAATEHFIKALRLDSSLTLDPVLTSPKILSVFESAKQEFRAHAENSRLTGQVKLLQSKETTFRALIFPGWDQLHQGRRTKGYLLLGIGAAAAVSAIASDVLRRSARTNYLEANTPALAQSRYDTYNLYTKTEFYSISAFVIVYLYSEFDSFLDLPPHFTPAYEPATRTVGLNLHLAF